MCGKFKVTLHEIPAFAFSAYSLVFRNLRKILIIKYDILASLDKLEV
ncbi:hypothetical protein SDC9_210687 [bioreactor metagenome]|uniref:Uncharacterized protein n=1 Tax=bioreactor metagenome TaxID=1076179 RepID=A0A645JS36_9ZZZZ